MRTITVVLSVMTLAAAVHGRPPASARINIREKLGTNKAGLPEPAAAAGQAVSASGADTPAANIPSKWLKNAEGFQEALEIQKQTGADIFVFFVRPDVSDEKGLCNLLETRGFQTSPVQRFLKEVIKVRATLPSNRETEAMAETFRVNKTPAVFMVHPNGKRWRCSTFNYDNKRPELPEPAVLAEQFRSQSSRAMTAAAAKAASENQPAGQ